MPRHAGRMAVVGRQPTGGAGGPSVGARFTGQMALPGAMRRRQPDTRISHGEVWRHPCRAIHETSAQRAARLPWRCAVASAASLRRRLAAGLSMRAPPDGRDVSTTSTTSNVVTSAPVTDDWTRLATALGVDEFVAVSEWLARPRRRSPRAARGALARAARWRSGIRFEVPMPMPRDQRNADGLTPRTRLQRRGRDACRRLAGRPTSPRQAAHPRRRSPSSCLFSDSRHHRRSARRASGDPRGLPDFLGSARRSLQRTISRRHHPVGECPR